MFGPINALCTLASHAFDALAKISYPAADAMWNAAPRRDDEDTAGSSSEITYLDEIAGHLAAQTPLIEDIRNLLNHRAGAPVNNYNVSVDAGSGPASGCPPTPGAGLSTKVLRTAGKGLRAWADGEVCDATHYWRSIANSLTNVADVRDAIATTE